MVLGVDWLKNINPVIFDFKNLTLQFTYQGNPILLQGVTNSALLRVIGVELLDDFTSLEDAWMAHLSSMQGEAIGEQLTEAMKELIQ